MTKTQASIRQFRKAFRQFQKSLCLPPNDIHRDAAIQRFEFTIDLAWKTLKALLEEQGVFCSSPKGCFRDAYRQGLLDYSRVWMDFVDLRNLTSHTYKESLAKKVYKKLPLAERHLEKLLAKLTKVSSSKSSKAH